MAPIIMLSLNSAQRSTSRRSKNGASLGYSHVKWALSPCCPTRWSSRLNLIQSSWGISALLYGTLCLGFLRRQERWLEFDQIKHVYSYRSRETQSKTQCLDLGPLCTFWTAEVEGSKETSLCPLWKWLFFLVGSAAEARMATEFHGANHIWIGIWFLDTPTAPYRPGWLRGLCRLTWSWCRCKIVSSRYYTLARRSHSKECQAGALTLLTFCSQSSGHLWKFRSDPVSKIKDQT